MKFLKLRKSLKRQKPEDIQKEDDEKELPDSAKAS